MKKLQDVSWPGFALYKSKNKGMSWSAANSDRDLVPHEEPEVEQDRI